MSRSPQVVPGPAAAGRASPVLPGAEVRWTGRRHGDLSSSPPAPAWPGVVDLPVCRLRQVHGDGVVVVERPGDAAGREGDALVTAVADLAVAVLTADCAPVALSSPEGVVAAVHGGWRGLRAGVVERAVEAMRALGATEVHAALGPCIRAECCQFGVAELDEVAAVLGDRVRVTTAAGAPALDLAAAVSAALQRAGATLVHDVGECTACEVDRYFSFRACRDRGRQATVVWRASARRGPGGDGPAQRRRECRAD